MDPHDNDEFEEPSQAGYAEVTAPEPHNVDESLPEGPAEAAQGIVLDAENKLLSLLSVVRTYSLTRQNGGMLPKKLCKSAKDVVDEAFAQGLVAFASAEGPGGKRKGVVLTHKGYDALLSGDV